MRAVLPAVGWWFSRLLGPLFTCQVVAHFPKEDFSVFILKTLVFCEQRGSFCVDGSGRSDEDISRRCHPRCPAGRAPVGEGVEGGGAVGGGGGDGEGRGGGGGRHPGVQEEGEGSLLFKGVDLCDLSCYTESP